MATAVKHDLPLTDMSASVDKFLARMSWDGCTDFRRMCFQLDKTVCDKGCRLYRRYSQLFPFIRSDTLKETVSCRT